MSSRFYEFKVPKSKEKNEETVNEDDLSFEECCLLATNMELSQKECQAIQPKSFVNKVKATSGKANSKSYNHRGHSRSSGQDRSKSPNNSQSGFAECRRCGRKHNPKTCPAVNWKCFVCNKTGHTSKMCFHKEQNYNRNQRSKSSHIRSFTIDEELEEEVANINMVSRKKFKSERFVDHSPLERELEVEGKNVTFEVDSAAAATVMCEEEYVERFSHIKLSKVSDKFKVITRESIKTLGQMEERVWFNGVLNLLSLVVVATDGYVRALLGRPWLDVLEPGWRNLLKSKSNKINSVSTKTDAKVLKGLKKKFPKVFVRNNRPIKDFKADIVLKEDVVPTFHAPYSVPFKLRERFEKELQSEVDNSILE